MYIFGGRFDRIGPQQISENIYDNRLYVFDSRDNSWSLVTVGGQIPRGRRSHSACLYRLKYLFPLYFLVFLVAYDGKLYIFGGYNNVMGLHFSELHEFNPLTSIWRRVQTRGISNPVPRRRQCCVVINHRMYLFGGTSPLSNSTVSNDPIEFRDLDGGRTILYDQSDLYVFDFGRIIVFNLVLNEILCFSSDFKNLVFTLSCSATNYCEYSSENLPSRIPTFCSINFNSTTIDRSKQWINRFITYRSNLFFLNARFFLIFKYNREYYSSDLNHRIC